MKAVLYRFILLTIFAFVSAYSFAIHPSKILNPPEFETVEYRTEYRPYRLFYPQPDQSAVQTLVYNDFDFLTDYYFLGFMLPHYHRVDWNVKEQKVLGESTGWGRMAVGEIAIVTSTVQMNDHWLILENSYYNAIYDGETGYQPVMAALSPSQPVVGGAVSFNSRDRFDYNEHIRLYIWDSQNGKLLFHQTGLWEYYSSQLPLETRFSPTGRFLLIRSIVVAPNVFPFRDSPKYVAHSNAKLFQLDKQEFWTADRDVAFSSDDGYLVTARDGQPTLVDAETDQNRLRYEMPSPMLAAIFSPDDREVYIAGEDNKIYVFESGIPSRLADWPLLD